MNRGEEAIATTNTGPTSTVILFTRTYRNIHDTRIRIRIYTGQTDCGMFLLNFKKRFLIVFIRREDKINWLRCYFVCRFGHHLKLIQNRWKSYVSLFFNI